MPKILRKATRSLALNGVIKTSQIVAERISAYLKFFLDRLELRMRWIVLRTAEDRFTYIYQTNRWRSNESASGEGSTLDYTANLREELPKLFETYKVKSVLDAPCGDFNWMKDILSRADVKYVGGDIVKPLIDALNKSESSDRRAFIYLDITRDPLPNVDLMICRDCLFHLSYSDTFSFLKNFVASQIPFLLTTSHLANDAFQNRDIRTGDFRMMDLLSPPYNFPPNHLVAIDDWVRPHPPRQLCLWTREDIEQALNDTSLI